MSEATSSPLRVEPLKASHFSILASIKPSTRVGWLQLMLVSNWLAQAERNMPNLLPATKPFCLVALEYEKPIALIVARPCNRSGTCWSVNYPALLADPKECSLSLIRKNLLQKALEYEKKRAQSWLIRCSTNNENNLSLARELGFQALKFFNCWLPASASNKSVKGEVEKVSYEDTGLQWQELNNENANHLWRLEQRSESSQLRQILDRNWRDLLEPKEPGNKVLISNSEAQSTAIAGLICRNWCEDEVAIELVRDIAWDARISSGIIDSILKDLINSSKSLSLETSRDDTQLTQLLSQIGWNWECESVLLGRSFWRRQDSRKSIKGTKSLESMLGRLNPQTPPLPTPSLGPR